MHQKRLAAVVVVAAVAAAVRPVDVSRFHGLPIPWLCGPTLVAAADNVPCRRTVWPTVCKRAAATEAPGRELPVKRMLPVQQMPQILGRRLSQMDCNLPMDPGWR